MYTSTYRKAQNSGSGIYQSKSTPKFLGINSRISTNYQSSSPLEPEVKEINYSKINPEYYNQDYRGQSKQFFFKITVPMPKVEVVSPNMNQQQFQDKNQNRRRFGSQANVRQQSITLPLKEMKISQFFITKNYKKVAEKWVKNIVDKIWIQFSVNSNQQQNSKVLKIRYPNKKEEIIFIDKNCSEICIFETTTNRDKNSSCNRIHGHSVCFGNDKSIQLILNPHESGFNYGSGQLCPYCGLFSFTCDCLLDHCQLDRSPKPINTVCTVCPGLL